MKLSIKTWLQVEPLLMTAFDMEAAARAAWLDTLDTAAGEGLPPSVDVETVNDALDDLARLDPALARLVEMRFFGGMSEDEIAEALGVSVRTVSREWKKARALLLTLVGD